MDSTQLFYTQVAIMAGSGLSFFGSLSMMIHIFVTSPFLRKTSSSQQQLFLFAFMSCLGSPALYVNRFAMSDPLYCQVQGVVIQFLVLSLPILCLCISLNFYLILTNKVREGVWIILVSMLLGLGIPGGLAGYTYYQKAYGPALIWCWIVKARNDLRMNMFYIPLWGIILMGILLNIMAIFHVYSVERTIQKANYAFTRKVSKVMLYGLVFVICWIPGTTNRLYETFYGASPSWLVILHCAGTTSLGFWTSIVYFILWFRKSTDNTLQSRTGGESTLITSQNNL